MTFVKLIGNISGCLVPAVSSPLSLESLAVLINPARPCVLRVGIAIVLVVARRWTPGPALLLHCRAAPWDGSSLASMGLWCPWVSASLEAPGRPLASAHLFGPKWGPVAQLARAPPSCLLQWTPVVSCGAEASASAWPLSFSHASVAQLLTTNRRGILTFLTEEFLEEGEMCWALSM